MTVLPAASSGLQSRPKPQSARFGSSAQLQEWTDHVMLAAIMATNVQVEKNQNESSANVIRRFQKRVQGSGIIQRVRKNRYRSRTKSDNLLREARLKKLTKKAEYEKQLKLGKVQERPTRGRR